MKLLSTSNYKLEKSQDFGYLTFGLSLAPYNLSGKNLCPYASRGCAAACLFTAGMGVYKNVKSARIAKAKFFNEHPKEFLAQLETEISAAIKKAAKLGMIPAFRLNVVSDVAWENYGIFDKFPNVQFYDYSKNPFRMADFIACKLPANYHLTFSRSEENQKHVERIIELGGNVAAVFRELPKKYLGKKVVSGDENDLRFLDKKNIIVGLKTKGKAKKDTSGFVI
jgi:hypothetical protein